MYTAQGEFDEAASQTTQLEEMRKTGGDKWLSIFNAERTKQSGFGNASDSVSCSTMYMYMYMYVYVYIHVCTVYIHVYTNNLHVKSKAILEWIQLWLGQILGTCTCTCTPAFSFILS